MPTWKQWLNKHHTFEPLLKPLNLELIFDELFTNQDGRKEICDSVRRADQPDNTVVAQLGTFSLRNLTMAASDVGAAGVSLSISPSPSPLAFSLAPCDKASFQTF